MLTFVSLDLFCVFVSITVLIILASYKFTCSDSFVGARVFIFVCSHILLRLFCIMAAEDLTAAVAQLCADITRAAVGRTFVLFEGCNML